MGTHADIMRLLVDNNHPDSSPMVGWWILEHVTGRDRSTLLVQPHISSLEHEQAISLVGRMMSDRIPLSYILGYVPFGALTILVEPPVLIPRPETEEWVMNLLATTQTIPERVLDLCTGSGCIALSVAHAWPDTQVVAIDNCPIACQLALRNMRSNNLDRVTIVEHDITKPWDKVLPTEQLYNIITANPPYVSDSEWDTMAPEITRWENRAAHVTPDNGYHLIDVILSQAAYWLVPRGKVYIEIGWKQGPQALEKAKNYGFDASYIQKDSAGNDRVIIASRTT